ncbi:hypothetical protein ACG74X_10935 [Marivita sp. S0852]|uniref:hypothetical protein n=1 Tax=Marivita sp. S0852 TaxID=3373893 RepID=UPI003981FD03
MTDSFWIEDVNLAVLTDSPIEATDIADMARLGGYGPVAIFRSPTAIAALLNDGELRPTAVILSRTLSTDEISACLAGARLVGATSILVDNAAHTSLVDQSLQLQRPFSMNQLQAAFDIAGLLRR